MEELFKFTKLTRDNRDYLVDRYSERVESAEALSKRVRRGRKGVAHDSNALLVLLLISDSLFIGL